MTDFAKARKNMLDSQIHTAGVTDPAILEAFGTVPRETFVPEALQRIAYADEDLPIGGGRFLPEPITHSRMLHAVKPDKNSVVLDIGGGSGYPAAIAARVAGRVVALEDRQFLDYAQQVWGHLGLKNITPAEGALTAGAAHGGPYDIIFIHGAVSAIPSNLLEQLAPGGRLIAIVRDAGAAMGRVTLVQNSVGHKFSPRVLFEAGGHYLPGFEPQPSFVFK